MEKIRLALLSGGVSSERQVSLNSGKQVFEALDKNRYRITMYDPATDIPKLVNDAEKIDVALIILHGPFGEDGTIQGLLDLLDIPYQGAGVLGSSLAMNKLAAKRLYEKAGIPTPEYISLGSGETIDYTDAANALGLPMMVKPACAGSSVGMTIARTVHDIEPAVNKAFGHDEHIIMEKYINGREFTCGVLGNDEIQALPVIEIIPGKNHEFFDYKAKYIHGETNEICPAEISKTITQKIQHLALKAHNTLFLKGYSRTDMILSNGELSVLETNTIPGMTSTSLYPKSAQAAGYSFTALLDRLIDLAIENHEKQKLRRSI
jgi:D-alanine-D-alanine ligase